MVAVRLELIGAGYCGTRQVHCMFLPPGCKGLCRVCGVEAKQDEEKSHV